MQHPFIVFLSYCATAGLGVWIGMAIQRARVARELDNMHSIVSKLEHPIVISGEIKGQK